MNNMYYTLLLFAFMQIFGAANSVDLAKVPVFELEDSDLEQIIAIGNDIKDNLYEPQVLKQSAKNLMRISTAYLVAWYTTAHMSYQDKAVAKSMLAHFIPKETDSFTQLAYIIEHADELRNDATDVPVSFLTLRNVDGVRSCKHLTSKVTKGGQIILHFPVIEVYCDSKKFSDHGLIKEITDCMMLSLKEPKVLQQFTHDLMAIPAAYNVMWFLSLYMRYQDPLCAELMLKKIIPVHKDPLLYASLAGIIGSAYMNRNSYDDALRVLKMSWYATPTASAAELMMQIHDRQQAPQDKAHWIRLAKEKEFNITI